MDAPFRVCGFFALALAGREEGGRWAVGDLTIEGVALEGGREPESRDGDARSRRRNKEILTSDAGRLEMFRSRVPQWNEYRMRY